MEHDSLDWDAVTEAWEAYRDAVGAWIEVAADPEVDPDLIDGLIHQVMKDGRAWNTSWEQALKVTHHH